MNDRFSPEPPVCLIIYVFLDLVWQIKSKKLFVKCTFISIHGTWISKVMVTTVVIGSYSVIVPRSTVLIHLVFWFLAFFIGWSIISIYIYIFLFNSLCTCVHSIFINHHTLFLISSLHPSIGGEFKTLSSSGLVYPYPSIVWVSRLRNYFVFSFFVLFCKG